MSWKTPDIADLLRRKQQTEQTTSGNVGGFAVPLGPPLRQVFPVGTPKSDKKPKPAGLAPVRKK